MPFRLTDVKKTVRSRSDGERYLHPKLLDGSAVAAQVALALSYFHARLGRTRREVDPEVLVRFFGDPKVARGLISCLNASYRWRARTLAEVLDAADVARLVGRSIFAPGDLRLYLYDVINDEADGFLAEVREENLGGLARRLRLAPTKLEQLVALDADENAVLVRVGPVPEPAHVVALYNYHTVDAILRNSVRVELWEVGPAGCAALEEACAAQGIDLTWHGTAALLHNQADAFGSYTRAGARLARAVYTAAAAAPTLLQSGRACVKLPGKTAWYLFDKEARRALTASTGRIYRGDAWPELRELWGRYRAAQGTAGWRLVGSPDPVLTEAGLALAPFGCRRDDTQVYLWPVRDAAALADVAALRRAGLEVLPIVSAETETTGALPEGIVAARYEDGAEGICGALEAHWSGPREDVGTQALDAVLAELELHGFMPAAQVAEALGCASVDEAARRLRSLDPERGIYVPEVGLCSPAFAEEMRKGLRRARRRNSAA